MIFETVKYQWYKLSIKSKLLIFFAIIILFVSLISFYSHYYAYKALDSFDYNLKNYFNINRFMVEFGENKKALERYLKELKKEDLEKYEESLAMINHTVKYMDRYSVSDESYYLIRAIKNAFESYYEESNAAIEIRKDRNSKENYYLHFYKAGQISDYVGKYSNQLMYVILSEDSLFYGHQMQNAKIMKYITLISIFAVSILCFGFALVFSSYLTGPIYKLATRSIRMSQGELDVEEIKVKSTDEVGVLSNSFNQMSASIKKMVQDLKEKALIERKLHEEELKNVKIQQLLKETKLLALQSQINPHFLFNTLNLIARSSMSERADRTTGLIQSLSKLFRYNLRSNDTDTTLTEELRVIKEYLHIQECRFGKRMEYDIRCNENMEDVRIPSFTLQPLVENSIIHGIEPKEHGGSLRIKVSRDSEKITIKIIDNGIGICKEHMKDLLKLENSNHAGHITGIGLVNVYNRLELYYNGSCCFKIKSKINWGTVITILIPFRKEEKNCINY